MAYMWFLRIAETVKQAAIQDVFDTAFKRLDDTRNELEKVAKNDPDANEDIKTTASWLFHQQDYSDVVARLRNLMTTSKLQRNDAKEQDREPTYALLEPNDVIVYCTDRRYTFEYAPNEPSNRIYVDGTWVLGINSNLYDSCFGKDGEKIGVTMFTSFAKKNPEKPSVIQICPWFQKYLGRNAEDNCANLLDPSNKIHDEVKEADMKPADVFRDLVMTAMHELTHTKAGGHTGDVAPFRQGETISYDSYNWDNCVRLKNKNNADSYAQLGTMVYLIKNCGMKPKENGEMATIPDFKKPAADPPKDPARRRSLWAAGQRSWAWVPRTGREIDTNKRDI